MTPKIEQEANNSINSNFLKEPKKLKELDMNKFSFLQEVKLSMRNLWKLLIFQIGCIQFSKESRDSTPSKARSYHIPFMEKEIC